MNRLFHIFSSIVLSLALAGSALAQESALASAFASLPGGQPTPATVRVITDGEEAWYARWYLLENARKSIDMTYFIVGDDVFGRAALGMLLKKAREGVKVRLMLDARGSGKLTRGGRDMLQELAGQPGIEVRVYNPITKALLRIPENVRNVLASNHDKLIITDGEWLLTGGRNLAAHYFGRKSDNPEVYRDTDVIVQGGIVPAQGKRAFDEEFAKTDNRTIQPDRFGNWRSKVHELEVARRVMQGHISGMPKIEPGDSSLEGIVRAESEELVPFRNLTGYAGYRPFSGDLRVSAALLDSHSFVERARNDITPGLEKLIDAAQSEVLIQNPYVVLTDTIRACLKRASDRGVKITLSTNSPESTDSLLTQAMFVREWRQLLADIPTLRIHALKGEHKLHAKVFVIDNQVAVVGSYNLDPMSEDINSEALLVVNDPDFARRNAERVAHDVEESVEYTIRIAKDGSIEQVTGPSSHVAESTLKNVERLGKLAFLRPLI